MKKLITSITDYQQASERKKGRNVKDKASVLFTALTDIVTLFLLLMVLAYTWVITADAKSLIKMYNREILLYSLVVSFVICVLSGISRFMTGKDGQPPTEAIEGYGHMMCFAFILYVFCFYVLNLIFFRFLNERLTDIAKIAAVLALLTTLIQAGCTWIKGKPPCSAGRCRRFQTLLMLVLIVVSLFVVPYGADRLSIVNEYIEGGVYSPFSFVYELDGGFEIMVEDSNGTYDGKPSEAVLCILSEVPEEDLRSLYQAGWKIRFAPLELAKESFTHYRQEHELYEACIRGSSKEILLSYAPGSLKKLLLNIIPVEVEDL